MGGSKYEITRLNPDPIFKLSNKIGSVVDPDHFKNPDKDPHQNKYKSGYGSNQYPDPHQFADDKPKYMDYLSTFPEGLGLYLEAKIRIRIRIRVSVIRIRIK
jgi:hypothetical protein